MALEDGPVGHLHSSCLALFEVGSLISIELCACFLVVVSRALGVERTRVLAVADKVPDSNVDRLQASDFFVAILVEDDRVILQDLQELEVNDTKNSADQGSNPVDPVVVVEAASHNGRTEGSRRIETGSSPYNCEQVAGQECQTNADGSKVGSSVLLDGHHEDREDQNRGHEHLDQESLRNVDSGLQRGLHRLDALGRR